MMVFNSGSEMYSIVGKIEGDKIQWAQEGKTPQLITNGHYPKVAINDTGVVEVHKSQLWNTIWYRIGTLDKSKKEIIWSKDDHRLRYTGCNPAVALSNNGTVIVAYEQGERIFYCVGKVNRDATEIAWQGAEAGKVFSIPTKEPTICMNDNGLVVVAAETCSPISRNKIVFCIGTMDRSNVIMWREIDQVASEKMRGCSPVVAINNNNHIISVYMSSILRKLYVTYGVITSADETNKKIKWSVEGEPHYDTGVYPTVTLNNGGQVVRMREENGSSGIYYEIGNLS